MKEHSEIFLSFSSDWFDEHIMLDLVKRFKQAKIMSLDILSVGPKYATSVCFHFEVKHVVGLHDCPQSAFHFNTYSVGLTFALIIKNHSRA